LPAPSDVVAFHRKRALHAPIKVGSDLASRSRNDGHARKVFCNACSDGAVAHCRLQAGCRCWQLRADSTSLSTSAAPELGKVQRGQGDRAGIRVSFPAPVIIRSPASRRASVFLRCTALICRYSTAGTLPHDLAQHAFPPAGRVFPSLRYTDPLAWCRCDNRSRPSRGSDRPHEPAGCSRTAP
jgi:hypothetical protein